jgi:integrase
MIGKVLRGSDAGGLVRYLYGPGKANEHTDPHLVAGLGDPLEFEPDLRPDGSRDLKSADLTGRVRIHDLRHAHASWLLAGGADLQVVKQRLGHGSLRTTEKYLHTLPEADEIALDALSKMRSRASTP